MLYVYALLRQQPKAALGSGILDEPIAVVRCKSLLAAVGDVTEVPPATARTLELHDSVVRRLTELLDSVLPARYGNSVADESALCSAIAAPCAELIEALALVTGREQMTLRVFGKRPRASATRPSTLQGPGATYLRKRGAAQRAAQSALEPLLLAVAPVIDAERVEYAEYQERGKATKSLLASAYHLVPRGKARAYTNAILAASKRLDVQARVSGPSPAYAFAPELPQ